MNSLALCVTLVKRLWRKSGALKGSACLHLLLSPFWNPIQRFCGSWQVCPCVVIVFPVCTAYCTFSWWGAVSREELKTLLLLPWELPWYVNTFSKWLFIWNPPKTWIAKFFFSYIKEHVFTDLVHLSFYIFCRIKVWFGEFLKIILTGLIWRELVKDYCNILCLDSFVCSNCMVVY